MQLEYITSEQQEAILAQVKASCPAFSEVANADLWRNVYFATLKLSKLTCWNDPICGTFILGEREQVARVDIAGCKCFGTIVRFPVRFQPVDTITEVKLTVIGETVEVYTLQDPTLAQYIEATNEFFIDTKLTWLDSEGNVADDIFHGVTCGCCPKDFYITIRYTAGYELIPDCLLDLICKMVCYANASANGCDTGGCEAYTPAQWGVYLSREQQGDTSFSWSKVETLPFLAFQRLLESVETSAIYQISMCGIIDPFLGETVE